jgi:transposase-like protein
VSFSFFVMLSEMVHHSVEETLNQMLEAERLFNAEKYQRSEARKDTLAGFYQRKLHTKAGEVTLKMPHGLQISIRYQSPAQSGFLVHQLGWSVWSLGRKSS